MSNGATIGATQRDMLMPVGVHLVLETGRTVGGQTMKESTVIWNIIMFGAALATHGKIRSRGGHSHGVVPGKSGHLAGGVASVERQTGDGAIKRELARKSNGIDVKHKMN